MKIGVLHVEMTNLIEMFAPEGVWAVLSLILIFYIIRTQEKRDLKQDERDMKYQDIISSLTDSLRDLKDIKNILQKNKQG